MATTVIPGTSWTFKIGSTVYDDQVTVVSTVSNPNVQRILTLGGPVIVQTDVFENLTLSFLYDDESGLYGALWTASRTGATLTVELIGGDAKWTGSLVVEGGLSASTNADGVGEVEASFIGSLTYADVT
jgi:hypothetical protein